MTPAMRTLLGRDAFAAAPDADLLARYVDERDDVAFAELVHRHAPAVYAACRRFLADPAALDDAFHAVFVLLSKKAGVLRHPNRLHGWLCGAAGRVARKLRDRTAKRAATERPLAEVPEPATVEQAPVDLTAALDEELARLPPAYREAVVPCDVDGLTRRAAAAQVRRHHRPQLSRTSSPTAAAVPTVTIPDDTDELLARKAAAVGMEQADQLRRVFFVLTFFAIGLGANLRRLWAEGLGKLAAVYAG